MPVSMRSVRIGLLASVVLLVAVLAGYIGYARRQANAFFHDLPRKLGADITQETDHFTYSQSLKGKTVFTVHAAKAIEHKNGLITLRDVGIVLYGTSGERADRIHGQEFQYDQKQGILSAVGEAMIDLGPPGDKAADEADMIHVKTSGLVFRKDEGTAETAGPLEFTAHGMVGQAVGATYSSKTNVLVLESQVKMSGVRHDRPMTLLAAHAELQRAQNTVLLQEPKYVSATDAGAESVSAAEAVVHTSADGTPKDVEARGHVQLAGVGRGTVESERMDVTLNDDGQPRESHLYGGVRFRRDSAGRRENGQAADVRMSFDPGGRARHAVLLGAVQLDEAAGVSTRRLEAEHVELDLGGGGKQKLVLRGAVAGGADGARLRLVDVKPGAGQAATAVRANTLTGRFGPLGITGLDGVGRTVLERTEYDAKGALATKETSTGDTLGLDLKPVAKGHMELARAVEHGAVTIVRESAGKKPGAATEVEHARAAAADYDAAHDSLLLSGEAEVSDAESAVYADNVVLDRATGNATADGGVRVSYLQGKPGSEPVHVTAAHAVANKATGATQFTAGPGAKVRMWQGGSQVEAPVVDLDRRRKVMSAHGAGRADDVRTLLASEPAKAGSKAQPPVRVGSERMTYTEATREVDFSGEVHVTEQTGTLRAGDAIAFLSPAATAGDPASLFGGKVERVQATGAVELDEPGRKAVGKKIVYTAADDTYVLTGSKEAPPRLLDEAQGTITGALLRFKRGDRSVEVTGADGSRVRSEPGARQ